MDDSSAVHLSESAPSLSCIPEELLLRVVDNIRIHNAVRDVPTLKNISLVNRQLRRIATPFVYESFFTWSDNPFKFLRTLLARPELGAYLKTVAWGYGFAFELSDDVDGMNLVDIIGNLYTEDTLDIITKASMQRLPGLELVRDGEGGHEAPVDSSQSSWMNPRFLAAVLLLAPKISNLDYRAVGFSGTPDGIPWACVLGAGTGHCFMHLRKITITASVSPSIAFGRFLACTAVRELELVSLIAPERSLADFEYEHDSSNVEILKLRNCMCHSSQLAALILSSRKLKGFLYEHDRSAWVAWSERQRHARIPIPVLDYADLKTALLHHRQSLEHLAILANGYELMEDFSPADSLREFARLKSFVAPASMLEVHKDETQWSFMARLPLVLPTSLQHMTIVINPFDTRFRNRHIYKDAATSNSLNAIALDMPRLRDMSVVISSHQSWKDRREWEVARAAFVAAGKRLTVRHNFHSRSESERGDDTSCDLTSNKEIIHQWETVCDVGDVHYAKDLAMQAFSERPTEALSTTQATSS